MRDGRGANDCNGKDAWLAYTNDLRISSCFVEASMAFWHTVPVLEKLHSSVRSGTCVSLMGVLIVSFVIFSFKKAAYVFTCFQ